MGLKTTYYLRTLGASQIEKSTLDAEAQEALGRRRSTSPSKTTVPASQVKNALFDRWIPTCEACQ